MFLEHQGSSIVVVIHCVAMVMAMVFEDHLFSLIVSHCFSLPLSYSHCLFPAWTEIRAHLLSYPGMLILIYIFMLLCLCCLLPRQPIPTPNFHLHPSL